MASGGKHAPHRAEQGPCPAAATARPSAAAAPTAAATPAAAVVEQRFQAEAGVGGHARADGVMPADFVGVDVDLGDGRRQTQGPAAGGQLREAAADGEQTVGLGEQRRKKIVHAGQVGGGPPPGHPGRQRVVGRHDALAHRRVKDWRPQPLGDLAATPSPRPRTRRRRRPGSTAGASPRRVGPAPPRPPARGASGGGGGGQGRPRFGRASLPAARRAATSSRTGPGRPRVSSAQQRSSVGSSAPTESARPRYFVKRGAGGELVVLVVVAGAEAAAGRGDLAADEQHRDRSR